MSRRLGTRQKPYDKLTQEKQDFITDYLINVAYRDLISPEEIDMYREGYKNRKKWKNYVWRKGDLKHQHSNNPFCNICDVEFQPGDDVYFFQVNGFVIYHAECFNNVSWRRKLSTIYQDRGFWKRHPPKEPEKEPEVTEFYKPLREKSWELYEELRKEHEKDDK